MLKSTWCEFSGIGGIQAQGSCRQFLVRSAQWSTLYQQVLNRGSGLEEVGYSPTPTKLSLPPERREKYPSHTHGSTWRSMEPRERVRAVGLPRRPPSQMMVWSIVRKGWTCGLLERQRGSLDYCSEWSSVTEGAEMELNTTQLKGRSHLWGVYPISLSHQLLDQTKGKPGRRSEFYKTACQTHLFTSTWINIQLYTFKHQFLKNILLS